MEPTVIEAMLEEHRTEHVVHHDNTPRQVESPAMNAQMSGSVPAAPASRILEPQRVHTVSPAQHSGQQYRPPVEDLFNQLQQQLHIHSNILEEQRHSIERLDTSVTRLQQEQSYIIQAIRDVRAEVAARHAAPTAADAPDANEIDILTEQLQSVSAKANEVESLKVELNIMRRQLRRLDRHGSPPPPSGTLSTETSMDHAHPPLPLAHAAPAPFSANTPAGSESRSLLYQTPAENRLPPPILASAESRTLSDPHASNETRTLPGFRSIDPASSALGSWRPAGGFTPIQAPPAPPSVGAPTSTPQAPEAPPVTGWAAVNAGPPPKRTVPIDGHAPGFEASQPGSPKRQRLAPLMPRVGYGESSNSAGSPYQAGTAQTPDSLPPVPSLANSRNPSNESAGSLPPPSNPLRFVLSTQDAQSEDSWRPETQRPNAEVVRGTSRGSPRRGRGGGRGRGRKSAGGEEHGTPEWEQEGWTGSQIAPNGYYQPGTVAQAHDPANRGNLVRRGGGHAGSPSDRPIPGAPPGAVMPGSDTQLPQASLYPDPHFMPITTTADVASSAGMSPAGQPTKKTRTKPIRNADGVLIRKDGRPDMRSVSSAMNLKKVHAKKEAERQSKEASVDDKDRSHGTPHSNSEHDHDDHARSHGSPSTPAHGTVDGHYEDDEGEDSHVEDDEPRDASIQDRHAANMRKIFPYGIDGGPAGARNMAQAFFPPVGSEARAPPEVKIEALNERKEAAVAAGSSAGGIVATREKSGPAALVDGERKKMVDSVKPGDGVVTSAERVAGGADGPLDEAGANVDSVVEERRDVEMTDGA